MAQSSNISNQHSPLTRLFLIIATSVLLVICGGLGAIVYFFISNPLFETTVITEADFNSNTERLEYINSTLPITLPQSTIVKTFHHEGWQDWTLKFEGTIPFADFDPFIQSLPPLDQEHPDTFEGSIGADYIEIEIDQQTGDIRIEYYDL